LLIDSFNRKIDYIRVSVTSRCNFRCLYCMPNTPFEWEPKEYLLTYEEMFEFLKVAIDNGIKKIRITGGEPLIRKDLDKFIKMIADYAPEIDLAMTTNGYFLKDSAKLLKEAGLKRINISLDSLKSETYIKIAQKDVFENVIQGIEEAQKVGLKVKLNAVILKGINDNEIVKLYEYAKNKNMTIRFIEYMENNTADSNIKGLKSDEVLEILQKYHSFTKQERDNSPAEYFEDEDGYIFGLISPHDDSFCKNCNRIRLTAEGYLIPCLFFNESYQIREAIKKGDIKGAAKVLEKVVQEKPEKNDWQNEVSDRAFYETGG
jgi:cyclic pyranopterin phosphate synthase